MNDSTVRDLKKGPLTLLTGDRFNERFLLRKCMVVLHWSLDSGAPLFVDQTVARRAEKDFQTDFPPLLSQGLDDRSLTLSEGLDPPLLKHAHCM